MIYAVQFAPEAKDQLDAIEAYIALASGYPSTAARFIDEIVAYCEGFRTFPERGMRRDDLLPGLRVIGYRRRVTVAFRVNAAAQTVSIVGVFYGGQDYEAALGNVANDPEH